MGDFTAQHVSAVSFRGMQLRHTAPAGQCFKDWSNLVWSVALYLPIQNKRDCESLSSKVNPLVDQRTTDQTLRMQNTYFRNDERPISALKIIKEMGLVLTCCSSRQEDRIWPCSRRHQWGRRRRSRLPCPRRQRNSAETGAPASHRDPFPFCGSSACLAPTDTHRQVSGV